MPRSDVYDPDAFAYRVTFAAAVIARGGETTRRFDATGEMNDGEAVTAALVRRAKANPGGNLARNLFRYIGEEQAAQPCWYDHEDSSGPVCPDATQTSNLLFGV